MVVGLFAVHPAFGENDFTATVEWVAGADGDWSNAANWSTGEVPGNNDDVLIQGDGTITVTISSGEITVQSLRVDETLKVEGGILEVTGAAILNNSLELAGGRLRNSDWSGTGALYTSANSVLEGMTLAVDLTVNNGDTVYVESGLLLDDATLNIASTGSTTSLRFQGGEPQTLGGNGEVVFANAEETRASRHRIEMSDSGTILTIAPGITVRTGEASGYIWAWSTSHETELVNQGTISAQTDGRTIELADRMAWFANEGVVEARDGATLTIQAGDWQNAAGGEMHALNGGTLDFNSGSWTNAGDLILSEAEWRLGGSFATPDLGSITRNNSTVRLTGTQDNTSDTLDLDTALGGDLILSGGRIQGGTVMTSDAAELLTSDSSTLEGVTLGMDLTIGNSDTIYVESGLTLDHATVSIASTGSTTYLRFRGGEPQTLGGNGEVVFANPEETRASRHRIELSDSGTILTIAPGITVRTGEASGYIWSWSTSHETELVNQGTISAQTDGRTIELADRMAWFANEGVVEARDGATLTILASDWENAAGGEMHALNGGTLDFNSGSWTNAGNLILSEAEWRLGGSFATADLGSITRNNSTVRLTGTQDNTSDTLDLDNLLGGDLILSGGRIQGGTIQTSDAAELLTSGSSILEGVTLGMDLTIRNSDTIYVESGLTLDHAIVSIASTGSTTYLQFRGGEAQTFGGNGEVVFANSEETRASRHRIELSDSGTILTIAPGITVRTGEASGYLWGWSSSHNTELVNQGTISAQTNGRTIELGDRMAWFANEGVVEARDGATLSIHSSNWSNAGSGEMRTLVCLPLHGARRPSEEPAAMG